MNLFISVVNHHHDDLIIQFDTLQHLSIHYSVIVKSNTEPSPLLREYCQRHSIHLLTENKTKGFGANNNDVFNYAQQQLGMTQHDYFLVLNPDVIIDKSMIAELLKLIEQHQSDIAAINLYKDEEKTIFDHSIRRNHSLLNPLKSLIGLPRNDIYDKASIHTPQEIDWAAGSFLLFSAQCYEKLNGFDETYFMYFEDADICMRAKKKGNTIKYFPQIEAIHLAQHANRKLFSKHFYWYVRSLLIYHYKKLLWD
ncbi:MAG: glycosyltransferase [Vibrio sp.]